MGHNRLLTPTGIRKCHPSQYTVYVSPNPNRDVISYFELLLKQQKQQLQQMFAFNMGVHVYSGLDFIAKKGWDWICKGQSHAAS